MTSPWRGRVVRAGDGPASLANIANIITVVRIFMAPAFVWMLLADDGEMGALRYAAAVLFIVAIVTDSVDGMLARGRNLITDLGKLLDPIADKILIGGALVALSILGELPWWVTILIMAREIGITVHRLLVLSDRVIPAARGGKLKTVLQAVAISFALLPLDHLVGDWIIVVNVILMTLATILTVVSGLEYVWNARKLAKSRG